ncbi:MAG TPA: hypothetical protein VG248_09470 [Caulobacteraceae bacterium]|jgi:hypothetical protein|nr:hypothetical protein [Caulobacteraceae bacterium]
MAGAAGSDEEPGAMAEETVYQEDASTGLQLIELTQQGENGHIFRLYRFQLPPGRSLPADFTPSDPADGARFEAAFDDAVDWLKTNPA